MFSSRCCSERGMNMERGRKKTSVRQWKHYRSKCLLVDFVFYRNCACCISSSASFLFPKFLCLLFLLNSFPFSIYFLSPFLTIPPFHPFLDPFSPFIFWHFFLIYFLALFSPFHFSFLKSLFFLCILPYFI